jgi:serine kinase of HPr protein (carbohydrate metabolism regulator)
MTSPSSDSRHASCVSIRGVAVIIEGPSGAGKSDLALRLIDRGAVLISDDVTLVQRREKNLWATHPANIAGKIEVRGVGIIDMIYAPEAQLGLIIKLTPEVERYPFDSQWERVLDVDVPVGVISPFEPSAPIKAELILQQVLSR